MNVGDYKQRLLDLEASVSTHAVHERQQAREQAGDVPRDSGDQSVADEAGSESLTEVELAGQTLQQIRDALQRIEEGTFGRCVVDGEPIEPKRLEAVPWTPYCVKHQQQRETASGLKTPTL